MWVAQKVWEPLNATLFLVVGPFVLQYVYLRRLTDVCICFHTTFFSPALSHSSSSLCCLSLPALLSAQVRVGADHSGSPVSRGLPLLTAPACAYVPDHVSQRQPRHVSAPRRRCSLPTGEGPASAAALPGAPARGAGPRALPAAAARQLPARQHRQPSLQPLQAGSGGRVRKHPGVPLLDGATKEKESALAQVQTQRPRGATWLPALPGLRLAQLPAGQWLGGGGRWEHALPQYAEHERRRARHPLQARAWHADFSRPERAARATRQQTDQTDALALQTGQYTPLERPPPIHKKRSTIDMHL